MTQMKKIGQVAKELEVNVDTLRYYEKIQLLSKIQRTENGIRLYTNSDVTRIIFIREAQKVGFTLEEIGKLLTFRDSPNNTKSDVRSLVSEKFAVINQRIQELTALKDEFSRLTELCLESEGDCPILSRFESQTKAVHQK